MRKRRKAKVVWLPLSLEDRLGVAPAIATAGFQSSVLISVIAGPGLGAVSQTTELAVVKDFVGPLAGTTGPGNADINASLADIEQSGYRLRRIVGKIGISVSQSSAVAGTDPTIFHVTAGFIIRRVEQSGQSMASLLPANSGETSPSNLEGITDPWIWRRSWDLANRTTAARALDPNVDAFAASNVLAYGSGIFDGPHVDAKTARIVGPEERLFLDIQAEGINGDAQGTPQALLVLADLRVLASMRTNVGNRRNASR